MKKIFGCLITVNLIGIAFTSAQQNIGIGTATPNISSELDITASNKGLLIPRMTTAQVGVILNPAKGLLVYDTVKNQLMVNMGTSSIPNWQTIVFASGWSLNGNSGTNPATNFIGTTGNTNLRFKINNSNAGYLTNDGNVFWGLRSGNSNTSGYSNIAIGIDALKLNTTRSNFVAIGDSALFNNGTGASQPYEAIANTAVGSKALYSNNTGNGNTANKKTRHMD